MSDNPPLYAGEKSKQESDHQSWGEQVLISLYNSLGEGRYYDGESQSSFLFDHVAQVRRELFKYVKYREEWES